MLKKIILDADFCIKMGGSDKYRLLEELLPQISEEVLIHSHAYSEVKYPFSAVSQLNSLIASGVVRVVDETNMSEEDRAVYNMSYARLASVMIDPRRPNKNKGEVCSLAYAKATGIPIFATDEKDLQKIIDVFLNTGMEDISCMRIEDLAYRAKSGEIAISRKQAKLLWRIAGKDGRIFNNDVWPLATEM